MYRQDPRPYNCTSGIEKRLSLAQNYLYQFDLTYILFPCAFEKFYQGILEHYKSYVNYFNGILAPKGSNLKGIFSIDRVIAD